ncbi:hypothetical protein ABW20_dc0109787 [Dactylellina cionopaga]|nr:hypothetical protein ABW20_dc0109787 [Dactylellina cionopaga]
MVCAAIYLPNTTYHTSPPSASPQVKILMHTGIPENFACEIGRLFSEHISYGAAWEGLSQLLDSHHQEWISTHRLSEPDPSGQFLIEENGLRRYN